MQTWLTVELVLGALLVTSFACVGLVALWAAASRRHWFLRAGVLMAVLAIPLLVPAYEPLLLFATQAGVILVGVKLWQRRRLREFRSHVLNDTSELRLPSTFRFSMATLMLVMVLISVAAAPLARAIEYFSQISYAAPLSMLVDGAAAGIALLLAAWIATSRNNWRACLMAPLVIILLAGALPSLDWLHLSITSEGYWPPVPANFPRRSPLTGLSLAPTLYVLAGIFWISVLASLTVACTSFIVVAARAQPGFAILKKRPTGRKRRSFSIRATRIALIVCSLLFALLPSYVLWQVLHPLPVPKLKAPRPNGIDDIAAAGRAFSNSPIFNFISGGGGREPSTEALATEVETYSAAFAQLESGMNQDVQVVMFPDDGDLKAAYEHLLFLRRPAAVAAYALSSKAELALRQGRYGESAQHALKAMRLSHLLSNGSDVLMLTYCQILMEGFGAKKLFTAAAHLSPSECRSAIAALDTIDVTREPLTEAEFRTRIRSDNVDGWAGRFIVVLTDFTNAAADHHDLRQRHLKRAQSVNRLLMLHLAVRIYRLEHGTLPDRVDQLVPEVLRQAPVDPFNPGGRPLRYIRDGDSYVAYSLGADGDDDGGRPPAKDPAGWRDQFGDGDFRLDVHFEPNPDPATNSTTGTYGTDTPPNNRSK